MLTYGCIIGSLTAPDADGTPPNVVLGFERLEPYFESPYFGAIVGRYANRIAGARFSIDGGEHRVTANEPPNHLHGGLKGFDKHLWQAEASGDGPPSFSRRRSATAKRDIQEPRRGSHAIVLGDRGDLTVEYEAAADAPTHVNLTQHSYFNLRGTGDVLGHDLSINANAYLPVDERLMPDGRVAPVAGTPFDFREPSAIGKRLGDRSRAAEARRRLRSQFRPESRPARRLRLAARASEPSSGRTLEVQHDRAGTAVLLGPGGGAPRLLPRAAALSEFAEQARVPVHPVAARRALPVSHAIHFWRGKSCAYESRT